MLMKLTPGVTGILTKLLACKIMKSKQNLVAIYPSGT